MDSQKQTTLAILGDSYSTFAGLMPQGNYIYYPHEGIPDVADAEDTWWRQLIARRHLRLLINDSSSGTTISTQVRPNHKESDAFIHRMKVSEVPKLVRDGVISGGMIPKVDCCVEAVRHGVERANIQDGRVPHSILIELLSKVGIGTMFS